MKVMRRHWRPLLLAVAITAVPARLEAASCEPAAMFAKQHALPPQACKVIDNGSLKQRVCTDETVDILRVEIPGRDAKPVEATHVLTWYNDVPRSHPSGGQFILGGTVFIGQTDVLSIRYRDFVRGDTAVSGGMKTPDDDVDVRSGQTDALACAAVQNKSDAEIEAIVASVHVPKR